MTITLIVLLWLVVGLCQIMRVAGHPLSARREGLFDSQQRAGLVLDRQAAIGSAKRLSRDDG